jgi:hypothetical protein
MGQHTWPKQLLGSLLLDIALLGRWVLFNTYVGFASALLKADMVTRKKIDNLELNSWTTLEQ